MSRNSWNGAGAFKEPPPKPETFKSPTARDTLIKVYTADITRLDVDAVVNASNENLRHLGGVAAALLAAAGPQLQTACNEYLYQQRLKVVPVGQVMVTPGFRLHARHVIHAVGPDGNACRDEQKFRQLLSMAIVNTFREAQRMNAITLALPLISAGIYAGRFGKGVCSEVLWRALLSSGELLRSLKVLHLVNNDPDVTRAILREAHSPDISSMLTQCDSSPTGTDTYRDREMDWQSEDSGRARGTGGSGSFSNSHSSSKRDGSLLATFDVVSEKKPPSSVPEEELVLVAGQWVPRSKLPPPTSPKPSKAPEPVAREIRLAGSDSPSDAQLSKPGDRGDDTKTPFSSVSNVFGSLVETTSSAIGSLKLHPSFPSSEQQPIQVRRVESTLVVSSGSTKLACAACEREPNRQTSEWFVQLPCSHNFCIKCFNEHVNRTRDSRCSSCSHEFELPSRANKADFLFLQNPKGDSSVLNPNHPTRFPRWLLVAPASDKERSDKLAKGLLESTAHFFNVEVLLAGEPLRVGCLASGILPSNLSYI